MTLDEAGRLQEAWKAKYGEKVCKHERMVDYLISKKGKNTGYLVCEECGGAFLDPLKHLSPRKIQPLDKLFSEGNESD